LDETRPDVSGNDRKWILGEKKSNFALDSRSPCGTAGIITLEHALHGFALYYFIHYNNPLGRVTRLKRQCFTPLRENREHRRLDFGGRWRGLQLRRGGSCGGGVE